MSDGPKKRGLFQIHLSTAIVLMFVAGGLVAANVLPGLPRVCPTLFSDPKPGTRIPDVIYGWPFPVYPVVVNVASDDGHYWEAKWEPLDAQQPVMATVANLLIGLLVVSAVGWYSERKIRRLERRP